MWYTPGWQQYIVDWKLYVIDSVIIMIMRFQCDEMLNWCLWVVSSCHVYHIIWTRWFDYVQMYLMYRGQSSNFIPAISFIWIKCVVEKQRRSILGLCFLKRNVKILWTSYVRKFTYYVDKDKFPSHKICSSTWEFCTYVLILHWRAAYRFRQAYTSVQSCKNLCSSHKLWLDLLSG